MTDDSATARNPMPGLSNDNTSCHLALMGPLRRRRNSINAMSPDPNALMAASASDAPFNKYALQRKSTSEKIATHAALATVTAACFHNLITGHLDARKPGAGRSAISLTAKYLLDETNQAKRWPDVSSSSLALTRLSLRAAASARWFAEKNTTDETVAPRIVPFDNICETGVAVG
jgi:hypothetical protein